MQFVCYMVSISAAVTFSAWAGLTALYDADKAILDEINTNYAESSIQVNGDLNASEELETAYRLKTLIDAMTIYKEQEVLPWGILTGQKDSLVELKSQYIDYVKRKIIKPYDSSL